jgi:hypothetical protein
MPLFKSDLQVGGFLFSFVIYFTARSCWPFAQHLSLRATPRRLSATAYSVHLRLSSVYVDRLLHPQLEDAPCRDDRGLRTHFSWAIRRSSCNLRIAISESRNYEISSKMVQTAGPVMQFCRDVTII